MEKQYELGDEVYLLFRGGTEYPFIEKVTIIASRYKRSDKEDLKIVEYHCQCENDTCGDWVIGNDIYGDLEKALNIIEYEFNIGEIKRKEELKKRKQELGIR